jgi:hypothetical protein
VAFAPSSFRAEAGLQEARHIAMPDTSEFGEQVPDCARILSQPTIDIRFMIALAAHSIKSALKASSPLARAGARDP